MELILQNARKYIGQRETQNNEGFQDLGFQAKMEKIGWGSGEAWCASFAKLVWLEAYQSNLARVVELEHLFSKSATQTYKNFDESDWKTQNSDGSPIMKPAVGALAVWRMGSGWAGHIGIVTEVVSDSVFKTIEGNTNSEGGREGIEVAEKERRVTHIFNPKGLNLMGFILPKPQ